MATLERAIQIAVEAHSGQTDKAGQPYILHPLRVMLSLKTEDQRIVAVLHDVVEDCEGWNFEVLEAEGFNPRIIKALQSVTKREDGDEGYDDFVRRAMENDIGRPVKRADLMDNMDIMRISEPTEADFKRLARYRQAIKILDGDC
jgi:(p)ppGpp synthase/HD superfamily hydrolase